MNGTYYVIKNKLTSKHVTKGGISNAPHLYSTKGRAEARRKQSFGFCDYEVVAVSLQEIEEPPSNG